jgi:hypothetical protein
MAPAPLMVVPLASTTDGLGWDGLGKGWGWGWGCGWGWGWGREGFIVCLRPMVPSVASPPKYADTSRVCNLCACFSCLFCVVGCAERHKSRGHGAEPCERSWCAAAGPGTRGLHQCPRRGRLQRHQTCRGDHQARCVVYVLVCVCVHT